MELGEQRSHAMLLVYVMSNLVPSMAEEPMKKLLTRIMELVQLRLQADAPSIGIETAPLNEAQVPQVRRRSLEGNPGGRKKIFLDVALFMKVCVHACVRACAF